MPTNLNALIRYKTINSCLYGGRRWTIKELIEACSNALAEARGRYEEISERTIRDDIRIMRSDILGFSAPLKQHDGLYFYTDPLYSILSISITDSELMNQIIKLLLELRSKTQHPELEAVLGKLMSLSNYKGSLVNMNKVHLHENEIDELFLDFTPQTKEIQKSNWIRPSKEVVSIKRERLDLEERTYILRLKDSLIWEDVYKALA